MLYHPGAAAIWLPPGANPLELDLLLLGFLQQGISQVSPFHLPAECLSKFGKFSYLRRHTGQMLNKIKTKFIPSSSQVKRI